MQDTVVNDALRITAILNKHLEEPNCQHDIKQIVADVLESEIDGVVRNQPPNTSRSESNPRWRTEKYDS
jgi:hypothetical protein